ncbi:hypothetical protein [Haliscomenobacter sp.]|uniref:hypothetical protein n=1 Tax=Haliscomenobacter sp. TaxID=2717303 RepID=UPI00336523B2
MNQFGRLIVILTFVNLGILAFSFFSKKEEYSIQPESNKNNEMYLLQKISYNNALLDDGVYVRTKNWKRSDPILVLRFSFRNCEQCKVSALFEMEKVSKSMNHGQFKVLGSFMNEKDFLVFKQNEKRFSFPIENVPENIFGLANEQSAAYPFFFVLFPDGTARHVFIPMKEDVERTRRYLEIIRQKYFIQDNPESK